MGTIVTIAERPDFTYSIRIGKMLAYESVEKLMLSKYLAPYGVIEDQLKDAMSQLAAKGKARIEIPFGKGEQVK